MITAIPERAEAEGGLMHSFTALKRRHLVLVLTALIVIISCIQFLGCGSSRCTLITKELTGSPSTCTILLFDQSNDYIYASYFEVGQDLLRCSNPDTDPVWTDFAEVLDPDWVRCMIYDEPRGILYAGLNSGVKRCDNPEELTSWVNMNGVAENKSIAIDTENNILYTGTQAGVFKCISPYGVPEWSNTGGGVDGSSVSSLVYDSNHDVLYAANDNMDSNIWKFEEETWTKISGDADSRNPHGGKSLLYDSKNDVLYTAAGDEGVLRCDNPATNPLWSQLIPSGDGFSISCIALDNERNILYAGTTAPGSKERSIDEDTGKLLGGKGIWICESPNDNPSWSKLDGVMSNETIRELFVDPKSNTLYIQIHEEGLWRCKLD